jgi:carbonic anhydrase/acetyltransferase-like protein (isoleucine patch superfamily)
MGFQEDSMDAHFELVDNVSIHETAFIAPNATIMGQVTIEADASVWFGAVIRAEMATVRLGERSNLQDGSIVHVDFGFPTDIGCDVTIGHRAVIHGATIERNCLIGIGAILLNGCHIGENSIVAAGALVGEGKRFPPNSLIMGLPAKAVREITPEEASRIALGSTHYVANAAAYARKLGELL